jgi:elongation factor 3
VPSSKTRAPSSGVVLYLWLTTVAINDRDYTPFTFRPFLPKLFPGLIKVEITISDPEARSVVRRAIATLRQVGEVPTGDTSDLPALELVEAGQLAQSLASIYHKADANPVPSVEDESAFSVSRLAANLVNAKNYEVSEWGSLTPYLGFLTLTPERS